MFRIMLRKMQLMGVGLFVIGIVSPSMAIDHQAALAPLVSDDTFAVVCLDVASLDVAGDQSDLAGFRVLVPESEREAAGVAIGTVAGAVGSLQAAGVERVYAVLGLGNLHLGGGPVVVFKVAANHDAQAVEKILQGGSQAFRLALGRPANHPEIRIVRHSSGTILVGQQPSLDRLLTATPNERPDLVEPLQQMTDDGAALAVVFSPGHDFRRVVRELWPAMSPLTELRGELADRWLRLEFALKTQATASAELVMHTTDAEAAELFVKLLHQLPAASEQTKALGRRRFELSRTLQTLIDVVPTRVEGTRVVMTLPTNEAKIAKLHGLASQASESALESSRRRERMNQFKHLALAMHNFENTRGSLPPAAIRDADGRPLLSWRVAILPFLEEMELYREFHLDEPWDSPHNLKLIDRMPVVYADPSRQVRRLAGKNRTTYVVPVAPGTVFDRPQGTIFKEITDGTSNTIMIVEVPPERAVIWTQPGDWEVDLDNPRQGIERTDRDHATAALCDGSVHILSIDIEADVLRALLTRAGEEVVDLP